MASLYNKYRPKSFDEVVGQDAVVASLKKSIAKRNAQAYLFHGPSGVGKTTLARICAKELGAVKESINEVDAATYNGVAETRELSKSTRMSPLFGDVKVTIVDECHRLSAAAWEPLLKVTEEPPSWMFWFFCTTELKKVIPTIKTRCATYALKEVKQEPLEQLIEMIIEKEGWNTKPSIRRLCAKEAQGSPRQAISNLEICADCKTPEQAAELLASAADVPQAVELARSLLYKRSFKDAQKLCAGMRDLNPESIRHVVRAYMTNVALSEKDERKARQALEVLDYFSQPFSSSDGISPVILACGLTLLNR